MGLETSNWGAGDGVGAQDGEGRTANVSVRYEGGRCFEV